MVSGRKREKKKGGKVIMQNASGTQALTFRGLSKPPECCSWGLTEGGERERGKREKKKQYTDTQRCMNCSWLLAKSRPRAFCRFYSAFLPRNIAHIKKKKQYVERVGFYIISENKKDGRDKMALLSCTHILRGEKKRKVYKMILSLSCSVTLSYSLSHSFSCAGFYKFVVRDDVISPAGVRNFGTYDDVFEHVHSVARVRKNWATVVANKSGCANGPEAP